MFQEDMWRCAVAALAAVLIVGCSDSVPEIWTLEGMNLRGEVESVRTTVYDVVESGGSVSKGAVSDSPRADVLCCFDREGRMVSAERFVNGVLDGWTEYRYGPGGVLDSICSHSVLYGADTATEVETDGDGVYRLLTYGENGALVSEESSHPGGRLYMDEMDVEGRKSVGEYEGRWRRGRRVRGEWRTVGELSCYYFDNNGDLERVESDSWNHTVEIDYGSYDDKGNWTLRTVYRVAGGDRSAERVEERVITYY